MRIRTARVLLKIAAGIAIVSAAGCAGVPRVHQDDLDAWQGRPVSDLEKHPVFLTIQAVRTKASDGTEIWNYVNGRNISQCVSGNASPLSFSGYKDFTACMQTVAACNNIFYIKDGEIERYTPIGTGGARCFTDKRVRPDFYGPTNL